MKRIWLIIQREYFSRVRNKTFILLTLLAPVFYGLLVFLPVMASRMGGEERVIEVVDESGRLAAHLPENGNVDFHLSDRSLKELTAELSPDDEVIRYILYIPVDLDIFHPEGIVLLSQKNVGPGIKIYIDSVLSNRIMDMKMEALQVPQSRMDSLKTNIDVVIKKTTEAGIVRSSTAAATIASFAGGFLIYMFVFLYGSFVLRGVQEEKHSRIVEILISSVRPFEIMMGKILGIALVGLTQFAVWVALTLTITVVMGSFAAPPDPVAMQQAQNLPIDTALEAIQSLNLPLLITMFFFFFIGGYLLYSSLFAAFAAAVDNQTDIYQFMLPFSLPLVLSITMIPAIMENPDSGLAFWLSIIPFTSPVAMMARLPFDVPFWQVLVSALSLIAGFIFTTWVAGKIYRTGILLYGKKITYKELAKWVFYK